MHLRGLLFLNILRKQFSQLKSFDTVFENFVSLIFVDFSNPPNLQKLCPQKILTYAVHTPENNNTEQHFTLNKTMLGTYITGEDLLMLKRCTVLLLPGVYIVCEINNEQVL